MPVRELTPPPNNLVNQSHTREIVDFTTRDVKILCWNINGLGDKLGFRELHSMIKSHDIIAFVETMKGTLFQQYLPGYQSYHFPRTVKHRCAKRDSGGILVFVSDALHKHVRLSWESDCLVWLQLQGKRLSLPYDINMALYTFPRRGVHMQMQMILITSAKQYVINRRVVEYLYVATPTHARVNLWIT